MSKSNSKKPIFAPVEEVETGPIVIGGIDQANGARGRRLLRLWFMVLAGLVVLMIVVGGLTRLSDSGLSITEWAPITGAIPPLSQEAWQAEFDLYRAIPEYQLQNKGMSLAEFKTIYWWEWTHRQLGRVIGLVWAIGFLFLVLSRTMPVGWWPKALFVGALGSLQGVVGWWMVSSGLTGSMLDVASYRLAIHLGLALVILGFLTWYVQHLSHTASALLQARRSRNQNLFRFSSIFMGVLFVQYLLGSLVAGIDAGESFGTWPLMEGSFVPFGFLSLEPWWTNFLENQGTVQFVHRNWAYVVLILGMWLGIRAAKAPQRDVRKAFSHMGMLLVAMIVLGIVTVLTQAAAHFAILHQFVAVVLWMMFVRAHFKAGYPADSSIAPR